VAGSLGYCGLDRRRQPLTGDEIRACWEALAGGADAPLVTTAAIGTADDDPSAPGRAAPLEFVEVHGRLASEPALPSLEPTEAGLEPAAPSADSPAFVSPPLPPPGEPPWSLWGDLDR
jgi:hypothetical protein